MTLSTLSVVMQIPQETKHRNNISDDSRSASNNSNQAQDFNIPDIFVNSPSHNTQSSKQDLSSQCDSPLFIVDLGVQNLQFHKLFLNILQYLASYWSKKVGTKKF